MTLAEANKRQGYDDAEAVLGEIAKSIDILDVMLWKPSTHGTYNKQFQATRLGTGAFSGANKAITTISSTGDYIEEPVKMYEGESQVDDRVLKGTMDPRAVRDSEDAMNLEGAFQDWAYNLFYGNEGSAPDNFRSLDRRRASLGTYCISGGGSGSGESADLTSAWTLEIGPSAFHLAYPGNSGTPGMKNQDKGLQRVTTPSGTGHMYAWCRLFEIWAAIVMRNERSLIRYCNIESTGASNIFSITDYVRYVKNRLQQGGRNAVVFMNRTLKGQLEAVAYGNVTNGSLIIKDIEGYGPMTFIAGIFIRMHEGITDAETALT
jgi:hypothetical protein